MKVFDCDHNRDLITRARQFLARNYQMAPETIDMLLNGLKGSLVQEFKTARSALARSDSDALSKSAHSLKGALRNIGLDEWASRAERIEKHQADAAEDQLQLQAERLLELQEGLKQLM